MLGLRKSAAFIVGLFVLSPLGPAAAQNIISGGGDGGGDCYRIAESLDGPYSLSFCLGNANRYEVTGNGLECDGGLSWNRNGRGRLEINLSRASCGRGKSWSADSIFCTYGNIGSPPSSLGEGGGGPQNVTPNNPDFGNVLRCTYLPAVAGHPSSQVTAHRLG